MSGWLVTLEGPEGAGKTTQSRLLAQWLRDRGREVLLTREPGGTPLGQEIRPLLLHQAGMTPQAEFLLYSADRAEHWFTVIQPALARGAVVICDRWLDSSLAYQGYGRGLNLGWLLSVSDGFLLGQRPHRTFVFDLPPQEGLARFSGRDRLEAEPLEFHQRVRQGFLQLAQTAPDRYRVLDARQTIEILQQTIQQYLERLVQAG
jgi:dTMP kinase